MTDFLLWLYYTMAGINKIVNKKDFCARLKNIIYLLSVYILYSLLIFHPLASPPGEVSAKLTKGGGTPRPFKPLLCKGRWQSAARSERLSPQLLSHTRRRCPGSQTGADEVLPRARTRAIYYIVGSAAHRSAKPSHKSLVVFPVLCYSSYRIGV